MRSAEIHSRFLQYFEKLGHTVVPSASLLADDPTLLVVNAGMVPFKPYFLGDLPAPYPRATSIQKCMRTTDIDNVGKTTRHGTFFQMAGNFSFGDYFKEKAIPYAWELLTEGYGFEADRLWATVYHDDDEAYGIWRDDVGLPAERIQRRGREDNYWSMGVPGPCGPCSEIYYDRGPAHGAEGGPVADEDRYLEVWNLVFMQYVRGPGAGYDYVDHLLGDLPARNIDTGMGIERMAMLLQAVDNMYEIDMLRPVLDRAAELTGARYGAEHGSDVGLRVIADHTRAVTMLIADGVTPTNEGRGYVLRRMLRRAVRNIRLLGGEQAVMPELVGVVRDVMGPMYPELVSDFERIVTIAATEEQSFLSTLRAGTTRFDVAAKQAVTDGAKELSGADAFQLHDTYGFPIELTLEMAAEEGLLVDVEGFRRFMAEQRNRAKDDRREKAIGNRDLSVFRTLLDTAGTTDFVGYSAIESEATVRGLLGESGLLTVAGEGEEVDVVLDRSPFYAEGGGQQGDTGWLDLERAQVEVLDTRHPVPELPALVVHRVRVVSGELRVGELAHARVDAERRAAISRAHTATHLIHRAFRKALGEAATQAGSLNAPGRLRFDFHSPSGVPAGALTDVEDEVNAVLIGDLEVRAFITTQEEARRIGAMALFGEKYGDAVRVVEVGDYARELCGGTHAARTGQLGLVKIIGEGSIGAGVRRVEALVGLDAFRFLAKEHVLLSQLGETLKSRPDDVPERVAALMLRLKDAERELDRLRAGAVLAAAAGLAATAMEVNGVAVVIHEAPSGTSVEDLRRLATDVRGRLEPARAAVVVVGATAGGKAQIVVATGDSARARGLKAGALVRDLAPFVGGRGGGKDDFAVGGGADPAGLPLALAAVAGLVNAAP
ncbi:MAG: alanine--tRNA ligase [Actinomycetota bacterium]